MKHHPAFGLAVLAVALLIASALPCSAVVYVKWDSPGPTFDGNSWETAYHSVQPAINDAESGMEEVWVAKGTYVGCILVLPWVKLYGGFAGAETSIAQRNFRVNETILDGDKKGTVVAMSTGPPQRLDGFTIRNGKSGNGGGVYCSCSRSVVTNNIICYNEANGYGGGIYCYDMLSNSAITGNLIFANRAGYYYYDGYHFGGSGGGIYCNHPNGLRISNNTIAGNLGNGIQFYMCVSVTVTNNVFALNSGGVCMHGGPAPTLRNNCLYNPGSAEYTGIPAGVGDVLSDPRFVSTEYADYHIRPDSPCRDAGDGSVIQAGSMDIDGEARVQGTHVDIGADESDGILRTANPRIVRVSTSGDDANDGSSWSLAKRTIQAAINSSAPAGREVWVAAGVYTEQITFGRHVHLYGGFAGTEAARSDRSPGRHTTVLDGGGQGNAVTVLYAGYRICTVDGFSVRNGWSDTTLGGGIWCVCSSPVIANNVITGSYPSGIYCATSSPLIVNNTIAANGTGIIHDSGSSPIIANTIVAYNSSGISQISAGTQTAVFSHNCVYGNLRSSYSGVSDPTGTNGNISVAPGFASDEYGDLHLRSDSPCVDAGDNTLVSGDLDIDGQPRVSPVGGVVDIGADESDGTEPPAALPVVVRVAPEGDDANDGSSWLLAKRTVQAGVDAASAVGGDVWVKAGTYFGLVTLKPYAYLYGGFAGTETQRDERDWNANETVLDGQYVGPVVTLSAGASGLDGFTVTKGKFDGGVLCRSSSLAVENSRINANGKPDGYSCRGIYSTDSSVRITGCTISANRGTGIVCQYSSAVIANNTITRNSGSGIELSQSSGSISDNVLTENSVAGIGCSSSSPTITGNTITGHAGVGIFLCYSSSAVIRNTILRNAGGVSCSSASPVIEGNAISLNTNSGIRCSSSTSTITGNTITGNSTASSGGGIYCYRSSGVINENTLTSNSTTDTNTGGGAIYCEQSSPAVTNNLISLNTVSVGSAGGSCGGGGIYCRSSSPTIANNTIVANSAMNGGGIFCDYSSSPTIANTILAYNSSGVFRPSSVSGSPGTPVFRSNCIFDNREYGCKGIDDPTGAGGNISTDPGFVSHVYGDFHIRPDSPCVGVGDISMVPSGLDIDGQPRVQPVGDAVDIGADESDGIEPPAIIPTVVRVSPDGDDANDGSSWGQAKRTVQAGIDAAAVAGGEVWVKAGTYGERINLKLFVYLYGGFGGTETSRQERDWEANVTTLDGQQGGSVVTVHCTSVMSAVDGFTITNGRADNGAGINCQHSGPSIANNTITANTALSSGGGIRCNYAYPAITGNTITANSGSGISCIYSAPNITDNTISGNTAQCGGGIDCRQSAAIIRANAITANRSTIVGSYSSRLGGGGISISGSNPTIDHNTLTGNIAEVYGAGICCEGSAVVTDNVIEANTVARSGASYGGGIYCAGSPNIARNTISGNHAGTGAGIACFDGDASISNNTITGNSTHPGPAYGGGIYCYFASPLIAHNMISGNSACSGGGIVCSRGESSPMIVNNMIIKNSATGSTSSSGGGGGVYCYESSPTILNCTIAENTCNNISSRIGGGGIAATYDSYPTVSNTIIAFNSSGVLSYYARPKLSNSCIYGNAEYDTYGSCTANMTISTNPMFVDREHGDYHLQAGSVCIDAGRTDVSGLPATDLDGRGRIRGASVDIGAYEAWFTVAYALSDARRALDDMTADLKGAIVSAVFSDCFYVQLADRSCGIRVEKDGHGLSVGDKADITGDINIGANGEKYIEAQTVVPAGAGSVIPVALANRSIGGGNWFYTPISSTGQQGVKEYRPVRSGDTWTRALVNAAGLNNIGLLVKVWGKVTYIGDGFFYLDDGSHLDDGSGRIGLKVALEGLSMPDQDSLISVIGVSSCSKSGTDLFRLLRAVEITPVSQ